MSSYHYFIGVMIMILENQIFMIGLWIVIFVLTLIIEICTNETISIWFSVGSLMSLVLACININWIVQFVVFLVLSNILLLIFYFILKRKLKDKLIEKNGEELIGTSIIITKEIGLFSNGEGKLKDIYWTCMVETDESILVGETAIIVGFDGNKLIVKKEKN